MTNQFATTAPQTTVVNRRQAAAVNITARHLIDREHKHITARQLGNMWVWRVRSQTSDDVYTVTTEETGAEYTTCNCADFQYRGIECKHVKAVKLLTGTPEPAPIMAPGATRKVRREPNNQEI